MEHAVRDVRCRLDKRHQPEWFSWTLNLLQQAGIRYRGGRSIIRAIVAIDSTTQSQNWWVRNQAVTLNGTACASALFAAPQSHVLIMDNETLLPPLHFPCTIHWNFHTNASRGGDRRPRNACASHLECSQTDVQYASAYADGVILTSGIGPDNWRPQGGSLQQSSNVVCGVI